MTPKVKIGSFATPAFARVCFFLSRCYLSIDCIRSRVDPATQVANGGAEILLPIPNVIRQVSVGHLAWCRSASGRPPTQVGRTRRSAKLRIAVKPGSTIRCAVRPSVPRARVGQLRSLVDDRFRDVPQSQVVEARASGRR
jgi:hypothetical protein